MNGLIAWWARNSVAANLVMIGIFVAGTIGFSQMEREMDPHVRFPGLQIMVSWPGAAPQEVEEQIVARIEESVSDMDAIEWVRSSSSEGRGEIYILAEQQVDFTQFMNDVKIRVDSISSFPRDIEPPQVQQWVNRNEFMRVAVHGEMTERELKRLAETLRRRRVAEFGNQHRFGTHPLGILGTPGNHGRATTPDQPSQLRRGQHEERPG